MINYTQIRDDIITQLHAYLNIPVINADQNKPKPSYPHVTYKTITLYASKFSLAEESCQAVASQDPNFEYDIEYTRSEYPDMTISITIYSMTIDEAEMIALNACEWFKFIGYDYLSDKNIIVVETMPITGRDTLIIDDYERRKGFDVKLRVASELTNIVPTIETVDINKEISSYNFLSQYTYEFLKDFPYDKLSLLAMTQIKKI